MAKRWRGTLLVEGVETGDHRMIEVGATRWRELPLDFRAVFIDGWGGHENAVCIGTIASIELRDGGVVWGDGPLLIGDENASHWANMNAQGAMRGVSVDLTGGEVRIEAVNVETGEVAPEGVDLWDLLYGPDGDQWYIREVWSDAEIGAATGVGTPAFAEAVVEVYDDDEVGAGEGQAEPAPVADAAAQGGVAAFAAIEDVGVGDEVSWTDDDGEHTGTVTAVDEAAEEVTVETGDGEEVTLPVGDVTVVEDEPDEPDDEAAARFPALASRTSPRPMLATLLARERGDVVTASGAHVGGATISPAISWGDGPPRDAFDRRADGPTPWTIEDDGTVYGHLALWGQCHTGFAGAVLTKCLMPEASPSNYSLFHASGRVRCDDGTRVPVGIVSMDTGHAPAGRPGRRPAARTVRSHYDDTGTQALQIRVRDDEWGPFGCGVVAPGLSVDDLRRAMAAKPSGDWRNYGDGLDLLGVLMVNVPGYPVYEIEDGEVTMLVASLSPPDGFELPARTEAAAEPCACGGSCCGGQARAAADAARAEPIRFPSLRLRADDAAMFARPHTDDTDRWADLRRLATTSS